MLDKAKNSHSALLCACLVGASLAAGPAAAAQIVESFGSWTLYRDDGHGKLCFLAAKPTESAPAGANRDAPLFYVSAWVSSGVKAEVSARLGFPTKRGVDPTVTVSGRLPGDPASTFRMFVKDDRAFVSDATQELKLLEAMKKGSRLTVQATSERGTAVADTYPLNGVTAGLQALSGACN